MLIYFKKAHEKKYILEYSSQDTKQTFTIQTI